MHYCTPLNVQEVIVNFVAKALVSSLSALAVIAVVSVDATPAKAEDGRNAAFIGGLATGAVVGGAVGYAARPYGSYYGPAPAYGYRSAYYRPVYPAYRPACWREREPLFDRWGNVVSYRSVRVCR